MRFETRTAVVLVSLVLLATAWSAEGCSVVNCMLKLFRCNRENLSTGEGGDCCPKYINCVHACNPKANPQCDQKGKRGSWNKRERVYNPYDDVIYQAY